ncbi:MAG: glycosyltransferase family 2 protein [candidate division KSB1 bacterium]|nr:glycosyltransferase family 2 protein [candidate division KSB1 bacterium]
MAPEMSVGNTALSPSEVPHCAAAVYAVVVTYNGAAFIGSCLRSLSDSRYPVSTVVVDNASTDNTREIVASFPDVELIPLQANIGFGRANNIGIAHALERGADFVFLLNQDARVAPETVGALVNCALTAAEYGILSPMHLNGDGSQIDYLFSRHLARSSNPSYTQLLSDLYRGHLAEVYPVPFVNAAAWLLSRSCLMQVGGFDPLFFMYGEDADYCRRATFHGFKVGLVPLVVIFHERGGDAASAGDKMGQLRRAVTRQRAYFIGQLKNPRGSFVSHLAYWIGGTPILSLQSLAVGDVREAAILWVAGTTLIPLLPRVWQHYCICRKHGPHWIEIHAG